MTPSALRERLLRIARSIRSATESTEPLSIIRDTCEDAASILASLETQEAQLREKLNEIERHCPCGARPESPTTHHHVIGCPVEAALALLTASSLWAADATPAPSPAETNEKDNATRAGEPVTFSPAGSTAPTD